MINDYEDSDSDQEHNASKKNKQVGPSSLYDWKDLYLTSELLRALRECGFEQPSQVQIKGIPQALQGLDLLCQAKSGMGKTAVFVISVLNTLKAEKNGQYVTHQCIVVAHTRELAHQIYKDFRRLGKYYKQPALRIGCFFGGTNIQESIKTITEEQTNPHIIISTPGRLMDFARKKLLNLQNCRCFVVDQCDRLLTSYDTQQIIETIMNMTPKKKQVMMFSATLTQYAKKECMKMLHNPATILIQEQKLILHGLAQYYLRLAQEKKCDRLITILDGIPFNQVMIFVNTIQRAKNLSQFLTLKFFHPICIHSGLTQEQRIKNYDAFKANGSRILIATDLFGRGIDIQRVNLVINFDFPERKDTYLHRVGRAGRFGTKGMAINFIKTESLKSDKYDDEQVLKQVQQCFKVEIKEMPSVLDVNL